MRLYDDLAEWWPLFSHPDEYADEAAESIRLLRATGVSPLRDVLELGSGGGNNASYLKRDFALTLIEPSAGMRAKSVALNPECAHLEGDMRTVRLGRTFDAVFLHDAVMYMTTEADLAAALETVSVHLRPGGAALILPDATQETFAPTHDAGGNDEPGSLRGVRWVEWDLPPAPGATTQETHYAILLRDADGRVTSVHDRHVSGLFPRATWMRLLAEAGLDAERMERSIEEGTFDAFLARKR